MNIYKVAIIGCGSIGALKPDHIDFPGSENILTHANAVDRHPQTELFAVIDTDDKQLLKAKTKWQAGMAVRSLEDVIEHTGKTPDIVTVAVPTEDHVEILLEAIANKPRLIIAEKPFCTDFIQAENTAKLADNRNIPIMVDYIRRFASGYQIIKQYIDIGTYGRAQNVRILYTRGLRHEACHAIDLMRYFFGECHEWNVLDEDAPLIDRDENDPSYEINAAFDDCPSIVFQPCDGRKYGIFEIDICFEEGRLRFIDNGLHFEYYPINEENEWGHKALDYKLTSVIRQETRLNIALYNLINNAVNFLDGKEDLMCMAHDAIKVHEILER